MQYELPSQYLPQTIEQRFLATLSNILTAGSLTIWVVMGRRHSHIVTDSSLLATVINVRILGLLRSREARADIDFHGLLESEQFITCLRDLDRLISGCAEWPNFQFSRSCRAA